MKKTILMRNHPAVTCGKALARARGFSLMEVLIALVVLAIGLLGLTALQNTGLRLNNQSYQRTQATLLISEMIDRMRANPNGVTAGNYVLAKTSTGPAAPNCITTSCIATSDIANYDMSQWINAIQQRAVLASGEGEIINAAAPIYEINVYWKENEVQMKQQVKVQLP